METGMWLTPVPAWGGLSKGTVAPASTSVLEKSVPHLPPRPSLYNFAPPFELLWELVSLCGPFKRNLVALGLTQSQSSLIFSEKVWGLLLHWDPGLGSLVWGWGPSPLRRGLHSWDIPPSLNCHAGGVGSVCSHLRPSYQSCYGFFCKSLVTGLLFS